MSGGGYGAYAAIAGGVIQSIAASKEQADMLRQFQREIDLQNKYGTAETNVFQKGLTDMTAGAAQGYLQQGAQQRMSDYGAINRSPMVLGGPGFSTQDQAALALGGQQRANLGAYSDWQLNQAINKVHVNNELNRLTNFAQGNAGVFPYKMYAAQHSQDELNAFGAMLSSVGGGGGAYGSTGTPPTSGAGYNPVDMSTFNSQGMSNNAGGWNQYYANQLGSQGMFNPYANYGGANQNTIQVAPLTY